MEHEFAAFARRIDSEVRDRLAADPAAGGGVYSETAFTELVLEYLAEIGMTDDAELCYYEGTLTRGTAKINAFAFSDELDRLDLFVSVYSGSEDALHVPKDEITKAIARATRFFEAACRGVHDRMEPSTCAAELAARIHKGYASLEQLRIFVITDGLTGVRSIDDTDIEGTPTRVELWDVERLFRGMQGGLPRDEINIDFQERYGQALPCLPMPEDAPDYTAYLAILRGDILYDLYERFGSRLLELNVRSFLSARGKVNSGIRKTLREEPEHFMAYNNGIVVTVDGLDLMVLPDGRPAIAAVRGLQVVNGGQTTASIHRARKVDKTDVSSVFVPAKITVIQSGKLDEMVQMISHYANTQNTIQPADFSANDPFHVEVERLSSVTWFPDHKGRWFYERARGQYQVAKAKESTTPARSKQFNERTPPSRKFTKTDLAKYINTWEQKPHQVSFGSQKNFNYFMQNLRNGRTSDWLPDDAYYRHLIAKCILFRTMQKLVRQEKFPAHQANIVAYTLAYLSWKTGGNLDLEGIWRRQLVSSALEDLLRAWAHQVDHRLRETAKGRMITEWAKKEACWEAVRELDLAIPDDLPLEMAGRLVVKPGHIKGTSSVEMEHLNPEDYRNIEVCKGVEGDVWLRIHAWGKKTGKLQRWQIGIAHTLAGYAATGWEKGPSPKQARHGAAMVQLAREEGLIS